MHPREKDRAQRVLDASLRAKAEAAGATADRADLAEWAGSIAGKQVPGGHDARRVCALPDSEAKKYFLHVMPTHASATNGGRYERVVGPETSVFISGPGEAPPSDAIFSQSIAEARADAMEARGRARALMSTPRARASGIPIDVFGKGIPR